MSRKFKKLLQQQKKFSDECFQSQNFTEDEQIEKHKTFCLALHNEISQLADSIHYKDHRQTITPTNRQQILYETVDTVRYALAILNLWDFKSEEFIDAFDARDASLWDKKSRPRSNWSGQPVAIVDVDDVLARFREGFFGWLNDNFNLNLSPDIPEYYFSGMAGDLTGEEAFAMFVDEGGFRNLEVNKNVLSSLESLEKEGYWIQLLTARPNDNLKCVYDTYWWLDKMNIPYSNIDFSFEKYRWLSDKNFFKEGKVKFAIDDSPKHAAEYASQGIKTFVPKRSYNKSVWNAKNIVTFDWERENLSDIV